jgi:hypothetical protein
VIHVHPLDWRATSPIYLSGVSPWVTIEQEATDWQKLYVPYMVTLTLIPAIAGPGG